MAIIINQYCANVDHPIRKAVEQLPFRPIKDLGFEIPVCEECKQKVLDYHLTFIP